MELQWRIIAAATNNGLGIAGAAGEFPVKILPVKVLQNDLTGTVSDIVYGIRWAVDWVGSGGEKVKVINLSFGERLSQFPQALNDAVQYAIDNGVVVIAAAGNDNGSVSGFYPADLAGVVSVGAADADHVPYSSSNTGADIMAPGVEILTTVIDSVYEYDNCTGTSFAAPFASAAAALLWTAYPTESALKITSALLAGEKEYKEWIDEADYEIHRTLNADKALKVLDPPNPPQNLDYVANDNIVQLTWDEPRGWISYQNYDYDLTAYRIYREGVLIDEITEAESTYYGVRVRTGYTDRGLTPGTTYHYSVTAVDIVGNESGSASITATTETAVTVNTTRISVSGSGAEANKYNEDNPVISADGRYVAFVSDADNLVDNDTNSRNDFFVHDRETGTVERVSVASDGTESNGWVDGFYTDMSSDGRYVVFLSWSSNLLNEYVDYDQHIYVHDRDADEDGIFDETAEEGAVSNVMVDVSSGGTPGNDYVGDYMAISDNGRYVAFKSSASNLVYGDTNESEDVFLRDLQNSKTIRMNVSSGGVLSNSRWLGDYLSVSDTGAVAYQSDASNLVNEDTNGQYDIFVSEPGYGLPLWPAGSELRAADVGQTFAELQWTPAQHGEGIESYRLMDSQQVIATVDGAGTSYMVQNLQPESEYTFRVDAADSVGNWVYGPSVTFTTSASSGTASLSVSTDPGGTASLQWDAATPESQATAYAVWRARSGGTLEQVAQVPLGMTSYQDTGLAAGTEYSYVIRIMTEDQSQFNHTEQVAVATPQIFVSGIEWWVPRTVNGMARLEENLNIVLAGETNRQAVAEVTYQTYDLNGSLQNTVFNVNLMEVPEQAGRYEGPFTIEEGTAKIVSIKGILSDEAGSEAVRETGNISLGVSGSLLVNILSDAPEILTDARLTAWSNIVSSGDQVQLSGTGSYELKGLKPSGDYRVEVTGVDDDFRVTKQGLTVTAGIKENISLNVPAPSLFQVETVDESGDPVQGIRIAFYDDTGSFIGESVTDRSGLTTLQMTYASEVRAKVKVENLTYYNREYTIDLEPGFVEKTLTLDALPAGTVKGYITNTEGQPIEAMNIAITQVIDKRTFSFTATSDENGYYETPVLAGSAKIELGDRVGRYEPVGETEINFSVPSGGAEQVDLTLRELEGMGEIDVNVYTKYLDGEWMGPMVLDGIAAAHMGLTFKGGVKVSGAFTLCW